MGTLTTVSIDSGTGGIAFGRNNPATGAAEFFDNDYTWKTTHDHTIYYWPATETFGGSKVYVIQFTGAQTANWGTGQIVCVCKCQVNGSNMQDSCLLEMTDTLNSHAAYTFDGAGFVGFPSK